MKASVKTWKDVDKYFRNTFVIIPEVDPKKAFLLEYAGPDMLRMSDVDGNKGCVELGDYTYNLHSPLVTRRQWYQYQERAHFISRIPARMWRKGISEENTYLASMGNTGWATVPVKLSTIQGFVENQDVFPKTLTNLEGLCSYALSPGWALAVKSETLFLLDVPVGKVSLSKQQVSLLKEFNKVHLPEALKQWPVSYV